MKTKIVKLPQKGAVAKVTKERSKLRNQPASPALRKILRKENGAIDAPQKKDLTLA
jgi:hypothetical protein